MAKPQAASLNQLYPSRDVFRLEVLKSEPEVQKNDEVVSKTGKTPYRRRYRKSELLAKAPDNMALLQAINRTGQSLEAPELFVQETKDLVELVRFEGPLKIPNYLVREENWWIDYGTRNYSFLAMHMELAHGGIRNNHFFLTLFNPELAGVDPFQENLSDEVKTAIVLECMINPYYYFREIGRIPIAGEAARFRLHFAALATLRFAGNCFNVLSTTPRQTQKTTTGAMLFTYLFRFIVRDTRIALTRIKAEDAKENLEMIRTFHGALPTWLQFSPNLIRETNTTSWKIGGDKNSKIMVIPGAATAQVAKNRGRGFQVPMKWDDEIATTPYYHIIDSAFSYAFRTMANLCRAKQKPYCRLLTTTLSTLSTDEGLYTKKIIDQSVHFKPALLDQSIRGFSEYLDENSLNMFVYVYAPYNMLRLSLDWIREQFRNNTNLREMKNEVLLQWQKATEDSWFEESVLDMLGNSSVAHDIVGINGYSFRVYGNVSPASKLILSVDTSGDGKEETALVIDDEFQNTIMCYNTRLLSGPRLYQLVAYLCEMFPRLIVAVERNNMGSEVIQNLIATPVCRNRLYYTWPTDRENPELHKQQIMENKRRKQYGFHTNPHTRPAMLDLISEMVISYPEKFKDSEMIGQISSMIIKKSGRIEHAPATKDDLVFAKAIGCFIAVYDEPRLQEMWSTLSVNTDDADYVAATISNQVGKLATEFSAAELNQAGVHPEADDINRIVMEQLYYSSLNHKEYEPDQKIKENRMLVEKIATRYTKDESNVNMFINEIEEFDQLIASAAAATETANGEDWPLPDLSDPVIPDPSPEVEADIEDVPVVLDDDDIVSTPDSRATHDPRPNDAAQAKILAASRRQGFQPIPEAELESMLRTAGVKFKTVPEEEPQQRGMTAAEMQQWSDPDMPDLDGDPFDW